MYAQAIAIPKNLINSRYGGYNLTREVDIVSQTLKENNINYSWGCHREKNI